MNILLSFAGRLCLALIFLLSAVGKITDIQATLAAMKAHGMAVGTPFFLFAAVFVELGGGLSVLTGIKGRWGSLALAGFLIPTTALFHNFWVFQGMERQMQMMNFMKNLAIFGGLLLLARFSQEK